MFLGCTFAIKQISINVSQFGIKLSMHNSELIVYPLI